MKTTSAHTIFRLLSLALMLLPGAASLGSTTDAATKKATIQIAENQKADVNRCVSNIKGLPKGIREAMLAEMSEFLFMDDGSLPYENNGAIYYMKSEGAHYKKVKRAAKYIGSDGKAYNFYATIDKRNKNDRWTAKWRDSKRLIENIGWETIASFFEPEIKVLEAQYAKHLGL